MADCSGYGEDAIASYNLYCQYNLKHHNFYHYHSTISDEP